MNWEIPGWLQQLGTVIGAGGSSIVVLKLIERIFKRDDRIAVDRMTISAELRQDIRDLKKELKLLEAQVDEKQERINALVADQAELRAENIALRGRYHELRNVMGIIVGANELYHRQLGLPEKDIPKLPDWIYQSVQGPTAREATLQPPERSS